MLAVFVALVFVLPLPPPFGEADATAVRSTESTLTLEVRVDVVGGARVVLVQPYGPDRTPLDPRPLAALSDGTWGAVLDVPRRADIRLGFEILDGGSTKRSDVHTLIELGVDPAVFAEPAPDSIPPPEPRVTNRGGVGLLALALGSAGLAIVAGGVWWWLRPVDGDEPRPDNEGGRSR